MAIAKQKHECTKNGKLNKYVPKWAIFTVIALLVGIGAVFAFNIPGLGKGEKVKPANGMIAIPLTKVSDGKAHFYRFEDGGKSIGFFVVKGPDGALRTAFDACDVCFHEHKGYEQQGEFMLCRNCGKKFAIDRIGPHTVGGCNPSYLPAQQSAAGIVISVNDLKSGAHFF